MNQQLHYKPQPSKPHQPKPRQPMFQEKPLGHGFTPSETALLHDAISLTGMKWFDGEEGIMAKQEQFELTFRSGSNENLRWVVMAFPLYNMNQPNSVEICLHFLAEAHSMIHVLDFQYQVGINMETENLEFLMQLPLKDVAAAQLSELIKTFFDALSVSVMKELEQILSELDQ